MDTTNELLRPKIHKSKLIKDAVAKQNSEYVTCENPDDLTFRPIVGGKKFFSNTLSRCFSQYKQQQIIYGYL